MDEAMVGSGNGNVIVGILPVVLNSIRGIGFGEVFVIDMASCL
jgi:hypothetical protein